MRTEFLSPKVKKAGYILLLIAAALFLINTSGLLTVLLWSDNPNDNYFEIGSVCTIIGTIVLSLAVLFIVFAKPDKEDASLSNKLLLPHYFKYAGYIFLFFTVLYASTSYKYRYAKTTKWHTRVMLPSYQGGLTDEQNKTFNSLKQGGIVEHASTIEITPLTLILPVGLLFLAFAKEKVEDELISKYRTQSLQLAILLLFFIILYQKFNVPEIKTLILTSKNGVGYFDIPSRAWKADVLINVVLIFSIVRMEYMLRLKPLFSKGAES